MKKKNFVWMILIVLLVGIVFLVSSGGNVTFFKRESNSKIKNENKIENSNPDFRLETIEGEKIVLSEQNSDFILLNFWAIRCPYCLMQMEELQKLDKSYSNSHLKIIGICVDSEPDRIKELADKYKVRYPMVISTRETPRKFGGIRGVPVTFLLDSERNILEKYIGYVNKKDISTDIK